MKKLAALVAILCTLNLSAASLPLVAWGDSPDLVEEDLGSPRAAANGEIPFGLDLPFTPGADAGYDGQPVYAGVKASGKGGLSGGARLVNNGAGAEGRKDAIVFGRAATKSGKGEELAGVFLWRRDDFRALNLPSSGPLFVSRFSFRGRLEGQASSAQARFVVANGEGFLISEKFPMPSAHQEAVSLDDPRGVRWFRYDPQASLTKIGAEESAPNLSDITAAGLFLSAVNAGSGALHLALSAFNLEGGTKPLVFAYYPTYRQSSNLPVERIPWGKVTHVIHSFAKADENLKLAAATELLPSAELVKAARAQGVKVLLALGGGANSKHFTAMSQDTEKRNAFIADVAAWVKTAGYDGVVLDWEFPERGDEQKFANFVHGLRVNLPSGSELGLAVGVSAFTTAAIDGARRPSDDPSKTVAELIDHLLVMSYDYHGAWNYAGFNAPLFEVPYAGDSHSFYSTFTMWSVSKNFPASKIVMGLAFYGRTFSGYKSFGQRVKASSGITYTEVLRRIASGEWTLYRDQTEGMTDVGLFESQNLPYLVKDDEMVSYEDPKSIAAKVRWFRGMGMRGFSIWEIGQDHDGNTNLLLDAAREVW